MTMASLKENPLHGHHSFNRNQALGQFLQPAENNFHESTKANRSNNQLYLNYLKGMLPREWVATDSGRALVWTSRIKTPLEAIGVA
ncbi:hypothetical protein PTKIN_Ptkin04bG0134900 [Pterospermum kingtungense]